MCTLSIHDERMGKNFIFTEKKKKPHPKPLDVLNVLLGQQQWTQLDDDASVATVSTKMGHRMCRRQGRFGIGIRMGIRSTGH